MSSLRGHFFATILGVVVFFCSSPASAAHFTFSQGGYSGGGVISGSFDGVDNNSDGQLSSFTSEITNFSLSFSGDSIVGNFTHAFSDLSGLVFDLNSLFIGDGLVGITEGLASNWGGISGFDYASGLGPISVQGGRVIDVATGAISSTSALISVGNPVPEPTMLGLIAIGLAGLGVRRRKIP